MAAATTLEGQKASKALVLHGAKDLKIESRQVSSPTGSDIQVAIRATGLCGSDLHYYNHGRNCDFVVREPLCLGHESAGTVTAIGPDVQNIQVGDRVALEVGLPCRKCALCKQGRYNICPDLRFRSSAKTFPHLDGTLMELTNHPSEMCHKLPSSMTFAQGALLEPLAVCLHAIHRSNPPTPETVSLSTSASEPTAALIFGAGAIGLLLASALLTTQPFTKIVIADIDSSRLSIATSLSSALKHSSTAPLETTLLPKSNPNPAPAASAPQSEHTAYALTHAKSLASSLMETHNVPRGFARVYDCTGVPTCIQTGIFASRPGGSITQIGMGSPIQTLPLGAAALREVDIIGVFRYDGLSYPAAVELVGSGKLDGIGEKVVTHRVGLEDGERAFELAGKGVDEKGEPVVKVVVES